MCLPRPRSLIVLAALICAPSLSAAQEEIGIAVLELKSKGDIEQDKLDALSDLLANLIRNAGDLKVIGMADIKAALEFEGKRNLLGCDTQSCVAELGGSLGVRYVVEGNVSTFGKTYLLNLKLLDTRKVEVAKGVSRTITGAEDQLIVELPLAVNELLEGLEGAELQTVSAPGPVAEPETAPSVGDGVAGTFPLVLMVSGAAGMPPYASGDNEAHKALLADLQAIYATGTVSFFIGYAIRRWITIGPRAGFIIGGDTQDRRTVAGIEVVLEAQFIMNLEDLFFQPIFYLAGGGGNVWDYRRGASLADFDSTIFRLEIGAGAVFPIGERWFFSARLAAYETGQISLHTRQGGQATRLEPNLWTTSINLQAMLGYRWEGFQAAAD